MSQEYYEVLQIPKNATILDINKAYRKLAVKSHPKKNPSSDCAYDQFYLINEAYDVLSDNKKRAVYDQFGVEALKKGIPSPGGYENEMIEGYVYHGNPEKTFMEFFSSNNPFQEYYDHVDGNMHFGFGGLYGRGQIKKDPIIERNLMITLEEVYHGCVKKMKITRRVLNPDGRTTSVQDKILTVFVKKGWLEGTRITFTKEGDQGPGNIPADVVFILKDRPHPRFYREKHNLICETKINLAQALLGGIIDINTLDDRVLHIQINNIVHPNYIMTVKGEGVPLTEIGDEKGDLIIKFNIQFPRYLSPEQKVLIEQGFNKK